MLYLLHGIGGDETEWQRFSMLDVIFDNLLADPRLVPMIVVKEKKVPHIWHVDSNAHDTPEWRNNLYLFSQRPFR